MALVWILRHDAEAVTDPTYDADLLAAARALVVDAAAAEAVRALWAAGVRCLLLRGPVIAAVLYDERAQRPYRDVDLLVESERLEEAEVALAAAGFEESPLEAALPEGRPNMRTLAQTRPADSSICIGRSSALELRRPLSGGC